VRNDGRSRGDGIYWEGGYTLRLEKPEFTVGDFKHIVKELHLPYKQKNKQQKRASVAGVLLFLWILAGWIFYMIFESLSAVDAFYFSIVTLSTVGLGDITPQTILGLIFTVFFDIVGLELMAIQLTTLRDFMSTRIKRQRRDDRKYARRMLSSVKRCQLELAKVKLEAKIQQLKVRGNERMQKGFSSDVDLEEFRQYIREEKRKLLKNIWDPKGDIQSAADEDCQRRFKGTQTQPHKDRAKQHKDRAIQVQEQLEGDLHTIEDIITNRDPDANCVRRILCCRRCRSCRRCRAKVAPTYRVPGSEGASGAAPGAGPVLAPAETERLAAEKAAEEEAAAAEATQVEAAQAEAEAARVAAEEEKAEAARLAEKERLAAEAMEPEPEPPVQPTPQAKKRGMKFGQKGGPTDSKETMARGTRAA
jgi:voltage-gated potassium channel